MKKLLAAAVSTACASLFATQTPAPFSPEQVLSLPFPTGLVASPVGSTVAWTFNERGVRNV